MNVYPVLWYCELACKKIFHSATEYVTIVERKLVKGARYCAYMEKGRTLRSNESYANRSFG